MRPGLTAGILAEFQRSDLLPQSLRPAILRAAGAQVGDASYIKAGLRVFNPQNLDLGSRVFINLDVYIDAAAQVRVGNRVDLGDHVRILTSSHAIGGPQKRAGQVTASKVEIEDGAWIGSSVLILPGVRVGRGCVLAAGSVVTKSCDADGLYAGVPARRVRSV